MNTNVFSDFVRGRPEMGAPALANLCLKRLPKSALLPVVVRAVEEIRRRVVLSVESSIIAPFIEEQLNGDGSTARTVAVPEDVLAAMRVKIAIGDGLREELMKLSIEQIECRIAFLERQVSGINVTIKRLRDVATLLRSNGFNTLEEMALAGHEVSI